MEMEFKKNIAEMADMHVSAECVPKVIYVSQKTVNWCAVKLSSCTSTSEPLLLLVVSAKSEPAINFALTKDDVAGRLQCGHYFRVYAFLHSILFV